MQGLNWFKLEVSRNKAIWGKDCLDCILHATLTYGITCSFHKHIELLQKTINQAMCIIKIKSDVDLGYIEKGWLQNVMVDVIIELAKEKCQWS